MERAFFWGEGCQQEIQTIIKSAVWWVGVRVVKAMGLALKNRFRGNLYFFGGGKFIENKN